jgi:hypothetical protein
MVERKEDSKEEKTEKRKKANEENLKASNARRTVIIMNAIATVDNKSIDRDLEVRNDKINAFHSPEVICPQAQSQPFPMERHLQLVVCTFPIRPLNCRFFIRS